jgi:hypothetical protein
VCLPCLDPTRRSQLSLREGVKRGYILGAESLPVLPASSMHLRLPVRRISFRRVLVYVILQGLLPVLLEHAHVSIPRLVDAQGEDQVG